MIKKVKNTVLRSYVIEDLNEEEILGMFYKKWLQKENQTQFRIEKVVKRKGINNVSNGKVMIIRLIVGLIKKDIVI